MNFAKHVGLDSIVPCFFFRCDDEPELPKGNDFTIDVDDALVMVKVTVRYFTLVIQGGQLSEY
ncbi:MAG: hypothetical protein IPJ20_26255 [Flammeovirgaceae bacterium]|nr:hypothetical protein [Flammeovirgaceae bacterium]